MKLDILFIHPNASDIIYQDLSKDFSAIEPPIWAGMLAQACIQNNIMVDILDCEAQQLNYSESAHTIALRKPRIACFVIYGQQPSASTQNMEGAVKTAEKLKKIQPDIKILFVGGHVAALPLDTMQKHDCIDYVCQNEGVYTILDLIKASSMTYFNQDDLFEIKGLGFRYEDQIIMNKPMPIVPREKLVLDLPGVAWQLLDMTKYRTALWHSYTNNCDQGNFSSVYTSLGCPMRCSFCMINIINRQENEYSDGSNVFRYWDPKFTIEQLRYLHLRGIKNLKIADEMFVLNPNHFLELCKMIIDLELKFNIWCYARIDTIKDSYLEVLKKAGVNWLGLGIESGVKKVRSDVIKGKFEEIDIRKVVSKIRSYDINVAANYIFGLPEDTLETMQDTLDLALELNTEMANMYSAMAYPGSPLHKIAKEKRWKLPENYSGYSQHSYDCQPLPTNYISAEEVLAFRDKAWMKYHDRYEHYKLIVSKFGAQAGRLLKKQTEIKLRRKLLGDK